MQILWSCECLLLAWHRALHTPARIALCKEWMHAAPARSSSSALQQPDEQTPPRPQLEQCHHPSDWPGFPCQSWRCPPYRGITCFEAQCRAVWHRRLLVWCICSYITCALDVCCSHDRQMMIVSLALDFYRLTCASESMQRAKALSAVRPEMRNRYCSLMA